MLKIIEGAVASVPPQGGRKHPHQDFIQLDTSNILFICGGAFEGLEEVVSKRTGKGVNSLGFGQLTESAVERDSLRQEVIKDVTHDDLLQYGLIPEFVGRMPIVGVLEPLDVEMMTMILTQPKNSVVKQFQRLFELDGVELIFQDAACNAIAKEALSQKTGARGLRTVVEEILLDVMYELPSRDDVSKCVIAEETVLNRMRPLLASTSESMKDIEDSEDIFESA